MINSTTRRRGRHAAAPQPIRVPLPARSAPQKRRPTHTVRLPGMEVLGFYDEPYAVRVTASPRPVRRQVVTATQPAPPAADAQSRVAGLWETTQIEDAALDWWKPQVIARRRLGGRRVRLSSILATAGAVLAVVVGIWLVVAGRADRVEQSRSDIAFGAERLQGAIPELAQLVSALDNPEVPDLAASTEVVLGAESVARDLFSTAAGLDEEDSPARAAAVGGASAVLDVASMVNRLLAYRLAAQGILQPPALPDAPSPEELSAVTELVTGWRVEVELALEEISSSALPSHHARLQDWAKGLDAWQMHYLDAVRQGDVEAADAARANLESQVTMMEDEMLNALSTVGGEMLSQLADAEAAAERLVGD